MKKFIALIAAAAVVALAGCNTVAGMGKDVEATGSAVETTANKAKPN
jgi:entericidin B